MSNSSDPYPRLEAQLELTRKSLEILSKRSCRIQIVTKSNLVLRDIDLLKKIPTVVSMTITTDEDDLARLIEPNAPPPSERLEAVRTLIDLGVPTSIRIDPIIPYINDNPQRLIRVLADLGVKHITSSTYKAKPDNWRRLSAAMPCVAERIKPLYFERCEKIGGYSCLPRQLRSELMQTVATLAKKHGIAFGTCREQLSHLNTGKCDGSWLFPLEATG
jgi:DNA repair photolyase